MYFQQLGYVHKPSLTTERTIFSWSCLSLFSLVISMAQGCFHSMTRSKYGHLSTPGARGGEHTSHHKTEDESQIYKETRDYQVVVQYLPGFSKINMASRQKGFTYYLILSSPASSSLGLSSQIVWLASQTKLNWTNRDHSCFGYGTTLKKSLFLSSFLLNWKRRHFKCTVCV